MRPINLVGWLPRWREAGWTSIPAERYAAAWESHGGSVVTHPQIVERLSRLGDIPVRYLGLDTGAVPSAALATWGSYLALSKEALKRHGKKRLFDLGNAEIILPVSSSVQVPLRFRGEYLSERHANQLHGLQRQGESLALLRPPEDYRSKFFYNQRRELRIFREKGGREVPVADLPSAQMADIYTRLFALRWGFEAPGQARIGEVFDLLKEFMTGVVLFVDDAPVAAQVLYRVESPAWISVEFVNAGVDPAFERLSPGSVLTFLNTQAAWEDARRLGKALRYSFGRADRDYKMRWCSPIPVYRC